MIKRVESRWLKVESWRSQKNARASRGSTLSRIGEGHLHSGYRHTAFADSSGTSFDRAGADIACSKNVRQAGLERAGRPFVFFPSRRVRHDRSRFDEPFFVALDLEWQPLGAWNGADHGKNRRCSDHAALAGLCIFQLSFFEGLVSGHSSDLSVKENLDVVFRLDPSGEIAGHFGKILSA